MASQGYNFFKNFGTNHKNTHPNLNAGRGNINNARNPVFYDLQKVTSSSWTELEM